MIKSDHPSIGRAKALLILQFLSDFGDQITAALLALYVLDITNSASQVGLVFIITTVGQVIFTFLGGVFGDRFSKRNLLFLSDFGRGIAVLLMILALQEKSMPLIYITSFLLSILGSVHQPVRLSVWTENIPESKLERYNSLAESSHRSSYFFGPMIASGFVYLGISKLGFAIDSLTFFICAIVFARIISHKKTISSDQISPKQDYLKGFKIIFGHQEMLKYITYDAIQMVGFGAFNATFLVLAQREFGWTKGEYSIHLSLVGGACVLAAWLSSLDFIGRISPKIRLISGALISALTMASCMWIESFPVGSVFFAICSGAAVLTMPITKTQIQLYAKKDYQDFLTTILASRVIIIKFAILFGMVLCLLMDDIIGLKNTLLLFILPIVISCYPFFGKTKNEKIRGSSVELARKVIK